MGGILLESREGLAESQEFGERETERNRSRRVETLKDRVGRGARIREDGDRKSGTRRKRQSLAQCMRRRGKPYKKEVNKGDI